MSKLKNIFRFCPSGKYRSIQFQLRRKLFLVCIFLVLVFQYNAAYIIFVISRAWYHWVTLNYKGEVVEVNVIDIKKFEANPTYHLQNTDENLPVGYLG